MPVCFVTVSEEVKELTQKQKNDVRKIVAKGLDSKSRRLDENHISLRVIIGNRENMLADIEIEVFAQLYVRRLFSRDKRANVISTKVTQRFGFSCATWINLQMVGYSRVTPEGSMYYSDSDNRIVAQIQKIRGVSTKEKNNTQ